MRVKLRHLERWNDARRQVAAWYGELLSDLPLQLPVEKEYAKHVYYMYTIRCEERDALREWLADQGIGTQIIYPTPVPMQPAYAHLGYTDRDIPIAARYAKELLCIPMFPELREEEVQTVSEAIHAFYASRG